jgi:hypothetical protein
MKTTIKFLTALLFVLTTTVFYGQNRGIAYQALIFKPEAKIYPGVSHSNTPLVDTEVCLRFTFTDVRKNVEYQEIIKIRTDNYGLVNTTIGTGQQIDGYVASFDQITWGSERKMLMVELDVTGNCTSFDIISNEPFLTVPFAQVANTISGVVGIANGGTGATNSTDARLNLGLNNVNNTSDLNKPISIATQAALNGKENTSNKSTDGTLSSNSDIKFPTEKAVKTYVDASKSTLNNIVLNNVTSPPGTNVGEMAYNTNPSSGLPVGPIFWNGSRWQSAATNSATNTAEGVLKLAGDLGGTANAPTVPGLALKEDTSNKSTDGTLSSNSDIKFPTEKAVKTYVDNSSSSAKGLQGTPISPNAPLTGQVLRFDGINWVPESLSSFLSTGTIEVAATAGQTQFTVPINAIGVIAFYINGVRLPKDAISISGGNITYNPVNNGSYTIIMQDRITYDYIY